MIRFIGRRLLRDIVATALIIVAYFALGIWTALQLGGGQ